MVSRGSPQRCDASPPIRHDRQPRDRHLASRSGAARKTSSGERGTRSTGTTIAATAAARGARTCWGPRKLARPASPAECGEKGQSRAQPRFGRLVRRVSTRGAAGPAEKNRTLLTSSALGRGATGDCRTPTYRNGTRTRSVAALSRPCETRATPARAGAAEKKIPDSPREEQCPRAGTPGAGFPRE